LAGSRQAGPAEKTVEAKISGKSHGFMRHPGGSLPNLTLPAKPSPGFFLIIPDFGRIEAFIEGPR
jgi:hypothetical protein